MIDPAISLAMSLKANPGAYAVLFGSGVSYSSGIPTGWGIIVDLIERVAAMYGEDIGDDPAAWYRGKFGKEPDYSELLEAVARTPTERSRLLRAYFEPSDQERADGLKAPTPAHRALARLAKGGVVRVFITTNFDRLLERALEDLNLVPTVIALPDDIDGAPPLASAGVTILKVHGDYVDCRILNTPSELAAYDPRIDALLDQIIAQHGFILAGWSAQWDAALVEAFLRAPTGRYATWWAGRRPPRGPGARLMAARRGEFVELVGADPFFTRLAERVLDGRSEAPVRHNLPPQLSSFVGRTEDIAHLVGLVEDHRMVTLSALGGSGKTRAALEVARSRLERHPDGCWFVDLTATDDPDRIPETVSRSLGYSLEKLAVAVKHRRMLVVLDNCEHVLDAVAAFLPDLLAAPHIHVLATSRSPIGIAGEVVEALPPLSLPPRGADGVQDIASCDAVQLFVQRAKQVDNRWRLGAESAPDVARICRLLDGHPLALELAAARIRLLRPRDIADRLESGLGLLKAGSRDRRPDRQRTLATAWQWSIDALSSEGQLLFEQLSVFGGSFSLDAAAAVASELPDVLEPLAELIDHGLLVFAGDRMYRMLVPVRQFAASKLQERGNHDKVRDRHTRFFVEWMVRFASLTDPAESDRASVSLWTNADNLRQAARSIDSVIDVPTRLVFHTAYGAMLGFAGLEEQGDEQVAVVLADPHARPPFRAAALLVRAGLRVGLRDRAAAKQAVIDAREAWDVLGDPSRRAECRWYAAVDALIGGDLLACEGHARDGLGIQGGGAHAAMLHIWLSWSLRRQDRLEEAMEAAQAAERASGTAGVTALLWSMSTFGILAESSGDWTTAHSVFDAQWDILRQFPDTPMVGPAAITLSVALSRALRGDVDMALSLAQRSNETFATRDDCALRMYTSMMHRGNPTLADLEASLYRLRVRLQLPAMEAAADSISERLDELADNLEARGRPGKAEDCRRAISDVNAAVGQSA